MSPNDKAGRIHKQPFVISTAALLAVCLISVAARFYFRFGIQKQISVDDGFLVVALCCLISAMTIMYSVTVDRMYLAEALTLGLPDADLPSDFIQQAFHFQKWVTITLMLVWCAIMSVKFSFLFFFRNLINRIRPLIIYWWVVTMFNVAVLGYGVTVYYLACPHFYSMKALECSAGSGKQRALAHALVQMILDLIGDFLILYIPVRLIWKVRIRWTQKAALAMSLCLTVFMIVITIIRVSGILLDDKIDSVWETYWLIISAEVGIIMTAVVAFRAIFVSRSKEQVVQAARGRMDWYYRTKRLLKQKLSLGSWRSKSGNHSSGPYEAHQNNRNIPNDALPNIPRAYMTGVRTFIEARGKSMNASHIMDSQVTAMDDEF